jgi:uncharacterized membrane protein
MDIAHTGSWLAVALPSFLASLVEFVEALTVVVAVGATRGWRAATTGALAGLLALALAVASLGPALERVPIGGFELVVGVLLLFFGMRWLRKAALRYTGTIALHDEAAVYDRMVTRLSSDELPVTYDRSAIGTAFGAVLLEGLEVVFIVIALGAKAGALSAASGGAAAAGIVVVIAGCALRAPLARVPENLLKFATGVMLSAFGTFWTGEALGIAWPGDEAALVWLSLGFLAAALGAIAAGPRRASS